MFTILDYSSALEYSIIRRYTNIVYYYYYYKANEKYIRSICKVFNTVYSLAKRSRPYSDVEE